MAWFSAGPQSNPANGAVLADTGPINNGGTLGFTLVITASAVETVTVEHRDAANSTTLESFTVRVPANDTRSIDVGRLTLAGQERVRIIQQGALTGLVHAMIAEQ